MKRPSGSRMPPAITASVADCNAPMFPVPSSMATIVIVQLGERRHVGDVEHLRLLAALPDRVWVSGDRERDPTDSRISSSFGCRAQEVTRHEQRVLHARPHVRIQASGPSVRGKRCLEQTAGTGTRARVRRTARGRCCVMMRVG